MPQAIPQAKDTVDRLPLLLRLGSLGRHLLRLLLLLLLLGQDGGVLLIRQSLGRRNRPLVHLHLGKPSLRRPLSRQVTLLGVSLLPQLGLAAHAANVHLDQPSDAPVVLTVRVVVSQLQDAGWLRGRALGRPGRGPHNLRGDARGRDGGRLDGLGDGVRRHVELALAFGVRRVGEDVVLVEDDANVFPVRVARGIAVVFDVARGHGVDRVVAAHDAVFAGPPEGAALLVDDVAGDDILVWSKLLVSSS